MEPHDLYGLPLERFTEARNALSKELRGQGRRDEAIRVSKLRKPSLAAWAVNQLVRTQPPRLKALFRSGDALQRTQADLLAGRSEAGSLRRAIEVERAAVDDLVECARGLLSSEGHELGSTKLEEVAETLHAAALDPAARALVSDGCLTRELRHVGLGALTLPSAPRGRAPRSRRSPPTAQARRAESAARARLERAEAELTVAEEERRRAEAEFRPAELAVVAARAARDEAAREHRRAQAALKD